MKKVIILSGMLAVVLGTVSMPLLMGHSSEVPQAEMLIKTEKSAFISEPTQEMSVETKKSGLIFSSDTSELELHDNTRPVYSMDEANSLIQKGTDDYYTNNGGKVIDVSAYAEKLSSGNETNSLENKSFIYHMMLNSVDYFTTAKGSLVYAIDLNMPINAEFSTNIPEIYAHESEKLSDGNIMDTYVFDGMNYTVTNNSTYDVSYWSEPVEFNISDNERLITLDEGGSLAINRNDLTHLPMSSSCCLFPQGYAMSRMSDFDTWNITGCEEFLQKKCAVIEGSFNNGTFVMYVDINHGSMLKYEEYSWDGTMTGYIETTSLEYESDVEKVTFDEKSLNK